MLIEELTKHISNDNADLIKRLVDIIVYNKCETEEDLDNLYKHIDDKLNYAKEMYKYTYEDYEAMDFDEIQEYDKYRNILFDDNSNSDDVIKAVIMLGYLSKKDMLFLKELYLYLIEDKI